MNEIVKKGSNIELDIAQNISMSKTLAFYNGMKVFIEGGYEGQKAEVKITKMKQSRWEGKAVRTIAPAAFEKEAPCEKFGVCGGCRFLDCEYEKQLELKSRYVSQMLNRSYPSCTIEDVIASPNIYHYRNKMEFSFGDSEKDGPLELGLHAKGKHHDIVSSEFCYICPEDFSAIANAVKEHFRHMGAAPYKVIAREGWLRHLILRQSEASGEILVGLVTTSSQKLRVEAFIDCLLSLSLEGSIAGIVHIQNDSYSDAVIIEKPVLLYGKGSIEEHVLGVRLKLAIDCFMQTNTKGMQLLYSKALEYAQSTNASVSALDLYCGIGSIGLVLSRAFRSVYGVEIVQASIESARENAIINNIGNARFEASDVKDFLKSNKEKFDLIALDPPRAGLGKKVCEQVAKLKAPAIVYVSCKPQSLMHDLESFEEYGYKPTIACPVDLFPHTEHVETVALMQKQ
ncbi:MAG: 23S rRNA (uracil(1939)-C(5))-methyltransferase RlmD [Eubacteriaceae bacterium]|nr:23S rRNA (uracil(1939)-C(5))-methyltransferase RlmD [Eubacteriaceae bacterium]